MEYNENYEKVYRFYKELFEATDEWVDKMEQLGFDNWAWNLKANKLTRFYFDWNEYDKELGDLLEDQWDEMFDSCKCYLN